MSREYSYRIVDPLLFYVNVVGNVENEYTRDEIDSQLKTELMTALQPAFAKISALGVRYSEVPAHTMELADALNQVLSEKWTASRGLAIGTIGISSMKASEEDEQMIKTLQKNAVMRDAPMAAAQLTGAQAEAMVKAAENENGAMNGFMGMNMAQNTGGMNANQLYQMAHEQRMQQPAAPESNEATWTCSNGHTNTGKFCSECGEKSQKLRRGHVLVGLKIRVNSVPNVVRKNLSLQHSIVPNVDMKCQLHLLQNSVQSVVHLRGAKEEVA